MEEAIGAARTLTFTGGEHVYLEGHTSATNLSMFAKVENASKLY